MNKAIPGLNIFLLLNTLFLDVAYGQIDEASSIHNSDVDLTVKITVDPLPDNALIHTTDSTIYVTLYIPGGSYSNSFLMKDTLVFDTSKTSLIARFDRIPVDFVALKIVCAKYDLKKYIDNPIGIPSDSIFTVRLKPEPIYDIMVTAAPEEYFLSFGYLDRGGDRPSKFSLIPKLDNSEDWVKFTILGRKKWKIKLSLAHESEDSVAKIDKKFSKKSFPDGSTFRSTDEPPFDWIEVEKLKE
jgi:hypothetical protein